MRRLSDIALSVSARTDHPSRTREDMPPIFGRKDSTGADMHGHGIAGALWSAGIGSGWHQGRFLTHPRFMGGL